MLALVLLATLIAIPVCAVKGIGRRAHYGAAAVVAAAFSFIVFNLPSGVPPNATEAEAIGEAAIDAVAPNLGGWLMVVAFGAVIGAILFRRTRQDVAL